MRVSDEFQDNLRVPDDVVLVFGTSAASQLRGANSGFVDDECYP